MANPRRSLICLTLVALFATSLPAADERSEVAIAQRIIDELLSRSDYMRYGEHGLHYAEACAAIGALRFTTLTQDADRANALLDRYSVLREEGTDLISSTPHVDFSVIGAIPLQAYLSTGDREALHFGLGFADRQWEDPRPDGLTRETRWWIDDMYMVGMLQMQAFRSTGQNLYADRAARFAHAYLEKLQQDNGLFHHGPDAPFFWGRGNGWVAAGLAETLTDLPPDHPLHSKIIADYRLMMSQLLPLQNASGMWRQLLDYPEAWEESSCTAMFAYAMQVGINNQWLDRVRYQPAVDAAWNALSEWVDEDGRLQQICVGTGQSKDEQYYLDRPRHTGDFHGQAPMLWLAVARLKSTD